MLKKQVSPKIVAIVFAVIVVCFAIAVYVSAWTEPSAVPPGDNVAAPLNVSLTGQIKEGGLLLGNSPTITNGLIVANGNVSINNGNVGIGTTDPSGRLQILRDSTWNLANTSGLIISNETTPAKMLFIGYDGSVGVDAAFIQSTYDGVTVRPLLLNAAGGNVGIGTSIPSYRLDVNGDINIASTGFLRIGGNAGSSGQALVRTATGMAWQIVSGGDITSVIAGAGLTGGGTSGDVTLSLVPPVGFTVCTTGTSTYCEDSSEHWTGTVCCVSGSPACTTGTSTYCEDSSEHWTGTVCCVSGVTVCTTGTSTYCTDSQEHWTGTMCCVSGVTVCDTGTSTYCTDSSEHWTGTMCCVE